MTKKEVFKKELEYIKKEDFKKSAENLLELVPDYFFEIPAASTGKYHPKFAQGAGGLVRHTKVAMAIANDILSLEYTSKDFTSDEKDLILIAILFHDTHKLGVPEEKYTRFDHPLLAANFIKKNQNVTTLNDEQIDFIAKAISSHMGQWNTSPYSDVVLPVPSDKYQFLVHKCDFLSSRKYINVDFNEKGDIIK